MLSKIFSSEPCLLSAQALLDRIGPSCWQTTFVKHVKDEKITKISILCWACIINSIHLAKFVLSKNADVNFSFPESLNPLSIACVKKEAYEMVQLLMHYGANPNYVFWNTHQNELIAETPFSYSIRFNKFDIVKYLFTNGALLNIMPIKDNPLVNSVVAATIYAPEILKFLLMNGANPILMVSPNMDEKYIPLLEFSKYCASKETYELLKSFVKVRKITQCYTCKIKRQHIPELFACGKCIKKVYCGPLCQREDWIKGHKYTCKKLI
jgi:ankyrin repeat protein